jgi:SNF2 family DNA or RNA helicase
MVAVCNYQRLPAFGGNTPRGKALTVAEVVERWAPEAMIIDESHYIVSPSGDWGRAIRRLAWKTTPWVRLLSGTPVPNHYGNLWGQLSALNPDQFGWHYKDFTDRYLDLNKLYPSMVEGYRNLPELFALAMPYCSFKRREEIWGDDQWVPAVREIEMPAQASKHYAKLAREWLIDDTSEQLLVDGSHILTRLIRLQQLASGFIQDDTTGEIREVHTAKLDQVEADLDAIITAKEKAIVFHRFTWEGDVLEARLSKKKAKIMRVNGSVKIAERDESQRAIEEDAGPIIVLVQTQSGGIGISYRNAQHALFVSESFSFVQAEQARDRIYLPGVPRFVTHYRTTGTVDEFIAERIQAKQVMHDNLTLIDRHEMAFGSQSSKRKRKLDRVPSLV